MPFLAEPQKNKDIYLKFYEGELDNIREVNASNSQNYIEYNLASGEYTVYKNSELIKGGKICGYENRTADAAAPSTSATSSTSAAPSMSTTPSTAVAPATDAAASSTAAASAVSSVTSGQSESVLQPAPKQVSEAPVSAAGTPAAAVPTSSSAASVSDAAPSTVAPVSSASVAAPASEEVPTAASSVQKADIPVRSEKNESITCPSGRCCADGRRAGACFF